MLIALLSGSYVRICCDACVVRGVHVSSARNNRADNRRAEEKQRAEKLHTRKINFFHCSYIIYYYELSKPRKLYRCYIKYRVHRGSKPLLVFARFFTYSAPPRTENIVLGRERTKNGLPSMVHSILFF